MKKERLGVYGGTFNPPHIGHRRAAEAFVSEGALDRLLIIPDYLPPHKEFDGAVSPQERLSMAQIAFRGIARAEVSDMELCRGGKSYTSDTLRALCAPERELFLLTGTDMFLSLPAWHEPETIFDLATIACIRREEDPRADREIARRAQEYRENYGARILLLTAAVTEVSSSDLRRRLAARDPSADALLPGGVYSYIKERGLYL